LIPDSDLFQSYEFAAACDRVAKEWCDSKREEQIREKRVTPCHEVASRCILPFRGLDRGVSLDQSLPLFRRRQTKPPRQMPRRLEDRMLACVELAISTNIGVNRRSRRVDLLMYPALSKILRPPDAGYAEISQKLRKTVKQLEDWDRQ
jgi:hypothetical protein